MASSILLTSSTSFRVPFHPNFPKVRSASARALHLPSPPKPSRIPNQWNSCTFSTPKYSAALPQFRSESSAVRGNEAKEASAAGDDLVGEDSAAFELGEQKLTSWVFFSLILGVVLFALDVLWINPSTGYGTAFISAVSSISESPEVVVLVLILIFAVVHSGLASLRDTCEKLIGERAYRVLFAGVSLPLALSSIVYFINHRYDGIQLWQVQSVPFVHELVWILSFISFFFLYPSTFNLLEVAAVDRPKMHLWETGIMRITRHPQMAGQVVWCFAHTLQISKSRTIAASIGLISHHLFGVWNGDRRLAARYGGTFDAVKSRTSIIPFAAILDGRQRLPRDYYKEFLRLPYLTITALTLGAYYAHPLMQASSFGLHW
nr:15-cis-zeta-carotene isomerase [Nervilia fordii]WFJ08638.1 15-cis-zeta-carotene isomerase [Nervilia fordii]